MRKITELIKQGLWFSLFNSILLLLIATRYFQYFHGVHGFLTIFYVTIATLSHFITLSFLAYLIFYVPIVVLLPRKSLAWEWAGIISVLCSTLLAIDTFVYQLYRFHLNGFVLKLLFGGAGGQIFQFHWKQFLVVSVTIGGFILLVFAIAYTFFKSSLSLKLKGGIWLIAITFLMMASSHFIHAWADAANYTAITKSSRYFPLYFPTRTKTFMLDVGLVDSTSINSNRIEYTKDDEDDLDYPKNVLQFEVKTKKDIVMILIDSWHYSTMNQENMPNIYSFSRQYEVYTNHFSGSNGTRTGVFSLFYSIPGLYWDAVLASQTSSILIDGLLMNDYQIKTFASASLASPPFDRTVFTNVKDLNLTTKGGSATKRDQQITKDWLAMSQQQNDSSSTPTFSFLFYDALHAISHPSDFKGSYQPEWEYAKYELLNNEMDPTPFFNLYKNSAYYVDSLVGRVLDDLKNNGRLNNTMVIITGDHGQEFNDNKKNYWGHNGNYSAAQLKVPLLIYQPDTHHKTYNHWTSHYDITPSIFEDVLKSANNISDYSIGKHLNDTITQRDWLLVGSKDNFGIVEPNRITSVYFDGTFDITDSNMSEIKNATLNSKLINEIMTSSKSFYK